ncbi:hypothetical protein HF072_15095 [Bacillus sp. RO3]|nr:hypothetical protein [Bacillus sp. RO3]
MLVDLVFMMIVVILFFYQIFIKAEKEDSIKFRPESLSSLANFLHLGALISLFAHIIFDISWVTWIGVYSVLGLILCLKPKNVANEGVRKVVIILLVLVVFNTIRIPTHPDAFQDYISSKEKYQCIHYFECVKMTSVTTSDDLLETKVEIVPVEGYSFDTYFLFAKGSMKLANEEEMKGVNIGGFWIEY